MGRPIHKVFGSALRILIAWLLALQPMTAAYAAVDAPLAMELCRGGVLSDTEAPDQDAPATPEHSSKCCLACARTPVAPPVAGAEIPVPAGFAAILTSRTQIVFVATAGLGPQSARAPPL